MNRIIAPDLKLPEKIQLLEPESIAFSKAPVYLFNMGTQDVVKVEFIFDAGSRFHIQPLIASVANELIDEGTSSKTSAQIAGLFDYYGAHVQTECSADYASVTLYTLTKFLSQTVSLLIEILNDPVYPEKEIQTFVQQEKQRLNINLEKVDFLARKQFNVTLYPNHSYGYFANPADYDEIKQEELLSFLESNYHAGLKAIIIAGKINEPEKNELLKIFEHLTVSERQSSSEKPLSQPPPPVHKIVEKPDAVQNAIRIGRRLFNRTHSDYPKLTVLNTILGGYFGSRLMSNIREDKGYTYGIGSGLVSLSKDGFFYIATEVGEQVCKEAVKEIYSEIQKLIDQAVPEDELTLVRNYLWGSFQRSIDGPFALADRFKSILLSGLKYDYFYNYLDVIKNISSNELQILAQTYLFPSQMTQIIVGKK